MWQLSSILPKELTTEERRVYGRYTANWTYLSCFLASGTTAHELGICLKLELEGKQREFIITRLLGKLSTVYREYLRTATQETLIKIQNKKSVQSGTDSV